LERWPQHPKGFRTVEDGISGGVTTGEFDEFWRNGLLYASNSAVLNGDYCFAMNGHQINEEQLEELKLELLESETLKDHLHIFTEINYHSCGSQYFFAENDYLLLVVAYLDPTDDRFPDDVTPSDFVGFIVPPRVGAHINSYIWHCPPILLNNFSETKGRIFTGQARVHSKIYYEPVKEHGGVLSVSLALIHSKL
jgi:hypothetical protein